MFGVDIAQIKDICKRIDSYDDFVLGYELQEVVDALDYDDNNDITNVVDFKVRYSDEDKKQFAKHNKIIDDSRLEEEKIYANLSIMDNYDDIANMLKLVDINIEI